MNQDQTVICFFAWSSALLAERKSALVSRKASVVRLFIEYLFMIPDDRFCYYRVLASLRGENRLVGATRTTADLPLLLTSRSVSWPSCCATSIVGVLQAPKTSKRFGLLLTSNLVGWQSRGYHWRRARHRL